MNRREFFTKATLGGVGTAIAIPTLGWYPKPKEPVRRKAVNKEWIITPPGPSYADPLNMGRKIGLRWQDSATQEYWGVVALLYMVHGVIPQKVMDVATERLLACVADWEKGEGQAFLATSYGSSKDILINA